MSDPARRRGHASLQIAVAGALVVGLGWSALGDIVGAPAGPAPLPNATGGELVTTLSLPASSPGSSTSLAITLLDPFLYAMTNISVTFGWYSFNPYPGTGPQSVPSDGPTFSGPGATPATASVGDDYLPGGIDWAASVPVHVPPGAPLGTYSVRDQLSFDMAGQAYDLASRGYFSNTTWQRATLLPSGEPTLNLTTLNVSGVLPETALLVQQTSTVGFALDAILGGALVAVGAGAYVAFRRGPASRSGTLEPPEPSQPRNAFGTSRNNDGD